ncbi:hypothetical protein OQA88_4225 [Cercophora sp. LCS_1]
MEETDDFLGNYVAAGSLILDEAKSGLPHELWSLPDMKKWRWLTFSDDDTTNEDLEHYVPHDIAKVLLWSTPLILCRTWIQNDCVRISFSISLDSSAKGIARVYIIADDVDNIRVPRQIRELQKLRFKILDRLNFSKSTWFGEADSRPSTPVPFGQPEGAKKEGQEDYQSLLQMFNTIPPPSPDPSAIVDLEARAVANRLLNSDVPGLQSTLYDYQRQSAALMLQREVQPEQALDPRLNQIVDLEGRHWYYDPVSGTTLQKPRYYDMPSGGILAEEMGSGKTLICLALILATKHMTTETPDLYRTSEPAKRKQTASLIDMAAACITRNSVPWKSVFTNEKGEVEWGEGCVAAILRHPGSYLLPRPPPASTLRRYRFGATAGVEEVYNSHASLVIVPQNLLRQWQSEIQKHTPNLKVLVLDRYVDVPPVEKLLEYEVILFTTVRFERLLQDVQKDFDHNNTLYSPLSKIHFKRLIVDEGHKLGNSTFGKKSDLLIAIDLLQVESRWIVTGTPSKGLYGVDGSGDLTADRLPKRMNAITKRDLDNEDAKRIGSIAALYLKMRPWANTHNETGDTPAVWRDYVLQTKAKGDRAATQKASLKSTLDSIMIRHPLQQVGRYLPKVEENYVYLEPSYQDLLAQNLFSMMIMFNSVQSQRTDQDFFFHPRQKKALVQLTSNLRQASFFGGSFFSPHEISMATSAAQKFLVDKKVKITAEDEEILRQAISFGRLAERNHIKECANSAHEVPIYLKDFPWGAGKEWSIDGQEGDPVCTDSGLVLALQKFLHPLVDAPASLHLTFTSGKFAQRGKEETAKKLDGKAAVAPPAKQPQRLAGSTRIGQDNSGQSKRLFSGFGTKAPNKEVPVLPGDSVGTIAASLAATQLVSTASAKLSYLIDQITKYQADEQIIVFYDNDNVAYYLAGILEVVSRRE